MFEYKISEKIKKKIESYSSLNRVSVLNFMISIIACYFYRISSVRDIVIGIAIHNRTTHSREGTVGVFSSIVPVHISIDEEKSFKDLLPHIAQETRIAYRHRAYSTEEVNRRLRLREIGRQEIFDISFSLEKFPGDEKIAGVLSKGKRIYNLHEQRPLEICLSDYHETGDASLGFSFSRAALSDEEVRRLANHLDCMIHAILDGKDNAPVSQLPIMSKHEEWQVLKGFNQTGAEYPKEALIHELFEQQVKRTPDAVAVQYEGEQLSYAELNAKANQLAHRLRALRDEAGNPVVGPDERVAICVERSLEMVVGLLGILKAGAAYVPVDPEYPQDRIAYVLRDAGARVVLTQRRLLGLLQDTGTVPEGNGDKGYVQTLLLDDEGAYADQSTENIAKAETGQTSRHLAYVIYTSGSTGMPKGVMVEHQNVARLFAATQDWFHFGSEDIWTLFHSFAFDFSVWEIWGALLHGGRLVVVPYLVSRSPDAFYGLLCDERVTVLNQTPSAFRQLMAAQETVGMQRHYLRTVIFGGEALEPTMLGRGTNGCRTGIRSW